MAISVDLNKAKELWKDRIRAAREPLLQKLDVEFLRVLEVNGDPSGVVARKQALRDVTSHPDLVNATSLDEIKAFWPAILNG